MLLCIDIGNTNITIGGYIDNELGPRWRVSTVHERMADEYGLQLMGLLNHAKIDPDDIEGVALASVVPPLTRTWTEVSRNYAKCEPMLVDSSTDTGVKVLYDDPTAVGADRVVNAAAAYKLYGGPICIVDFGTATTFDGISGAGEYLGGAIVPGIGISSDALFQRAAKLPKVDIARPPFAIGRNTVHSIQSGLLFGYVGLVTGMVQRFKLELGPDTKVVATGGLAELIASESDVIEEIAPWLTLDGLQMIYTRNHSSDE